MRLQVARLLACLPVLLAIPSAAVSAPLTDSVFFVGNITSIDSTLRPLLDAEGISEGSSFSGSYTLQQVPDADLGATVGSYTSVVRLFTLVVAPAIIFLSEPAGGGGLLEISNGPITDEFRLSVGGIAEGAGGFGASIEMHLVSLDGSALTSDALADPSRGRWDIATGRLDGQLGGFDFTLHFISDLFVPLEQCQSDLSQCGGDLITCTGANSQCAADLAVQDAALARVQTSLNQCTATASECQASLMQSQSSLDQCTSNLLQTTDSLMACNTDLAQCQATGGFPDADHDGVADAMDGCPATPSGAAVDQDGCSKEEFCSQPVIRDFQSVFVCYSLDWMNDHPLGRPGDCGLVLRAGTPFGVGCGAR